VKLSTSRAGWSVILAVLLPGVMRAEDALPRVRFSRDVLPILSENCFACHGPDAKARKADLRLNAHDGVLTVVTPGASGDSELIRRVNADVGDGRMPPPKSNRTLSAAQKDLLRRWVDQGAVWGKHWAYEAPDRPQPPAVSNAAWPRNPLDRFILARLDKEGLRPAPEAARETLIRRVTLDLTGLPPTPPDVDDFLADRSPDAYERLVSRLLASSRFGERTAVDWLDAARYADTNGYQNDFARSMWPWRDWVVSAFNSNMPFDRFVVDQIAGDQLPKPSLEQRIATGFNRNNRTVTEAGSIDEEWRVENGVDRVETTATALLGLTLGCCRCHDHKFDPFSQSEFYQFYAFFNSLNEKGVYIETPGNVLPLVQIRKPEEERRIQEFDAAIAAVDKVVKKEETELPVRQRHWEDEQRALPLPAEARDWILRLPLDGSLHAEAAGAKIEGVYPGKGKPGWADGPLGKNLRLDGKDDSFVDAGGTVRLERNEPFSYGAWVKPQGPGSGAILSKMDDANGARGCDLLLFNGQISVHLVHTWPMDAIRVQTRAPVFPDAWAHLFVTYDGSGKAAGVAVYVNGRRAALEVTNDHLTDSIAVAQPLRLGKRSTALPFKGELADARIYQRALSADEARALAFLPLRLILDAPAASLTPARKEFVEQFFRHEAAPDFIEAKSKLTKIKQEKEEFEKGITTVMVMEDMPTPRPTYVLKRGQYDQPDKSRQVEPGVPACLPPLPAGAPRNRLGLARWLVDPSNPLTARVAVNRFWQRYFGVGLVNTTENFGIQGEAPSHPELLDWLATEFVVSGWDVKRMQRLIVTSAAYRQSSTAPPALVQRDPENRLVARGPRFRLPAEVVRDNALAIGGLLTERMGGPSVKPYQPEGLWEELAGGFSLTKYVQDKGPALYRRSLYLYRKRTVPHPSMLTFDAPSREFCLVRRTRTNTPLQALELLNDVTYVEAARQLAQLMLTNGGNSPQERTAYGFRRAVARHPTPAEVRVLTTGLERYRQTFGADTEAARRFVRQGDSPVNEKLDAAELAAYTAVAGVILNMDETITKE